MKEVSFEDRLRILHDVANELSLVKSVRELCRRVVELGKAMLGFDRLSVWFIDKESNTIVGSFGIGEDGSLREEVDARVAIGDDPALTDIKEGKARSILETGVELRDDSSQAVGKGARMIAAIWNGEETIGYLFTDNLRFHGELTDHDRQLLELFAATFGHLYALRQSEDKLQVAYDQLKELQDQLIQSAKMEVVGSLASGVAHEVRNPLAIIQQGIDYITTVLRTKNENVKMTLGRMQGAIKKADGIIKGLLDFSSLSKLEVMSEDLNSLIYDSLVLVQHELDKYHITVRKDFEKSLPAILVDRNKIEQVFVNLFLNSIHHMPKGGDIIIHTYLGYSGDRKKKVFVDIEDTGTGIPKTILDKIFDPFFTTRRSQGGTGLGLSIVKNILDMHEARIGIVNREDGSGVKTVIAFDAQ